MTLGNSRDSNSPQNAQNTQDAASAQNRQSVSKPDFSPETMERLFFLARDQVAATVAGTTPPNFDANLGELANLPVLGAFVSFKKRGRLRSCMGYMSEGVELARALKSSAISAAREDPRFPPIAPSEFYDLDLEVWALGGMREIEAKGAKARIEAIRVGRDGVQIVGRGRRGLLLPSVAVELGWDAKRFLDGVCDKAGLSRDAWAADDVRLFAFEGVALKKPFVYLVGRNPELAKLVADENERRAAVENAENSAANAAPGKRPIFTFAPGFFALNAPTSTARNAGKSGGASVDEIRPAAVAGMFYPRSKAEQDAAFADFLRKIDAKNGENRQNNAENFGKIPAAGAFVPHAGWVYSGFIATETLNRVEIPETVVIFAPKHRAEGANFAVMPRRFWAFGDGQTLENDLNFVDEFCAALPEFKKDDVAHRNEHSIEVQLPILARLAPQTKVVGVLIGRTTATEGAELAERFARFLAEREKSGKKPPLLLISSDMNHYASDAATREIDAKALAALESLEPRRLFDVVLRDGISMCGVLPAYFVTSTLKKLGKFNVATKIDYGTSGDAFGDRERVVGYAGYAFR